MTKKKKQRDSETSSEWQVKFRMTGLKYRMTSKVQHDKEGSEWNEKAKKVYFAENF